MAYKNIREVMEAQRDLVTVLGQFDPRLVKMAPAGERSHRGGTLAKPSPRISLFLGGLWSQNLDVRRHMLKM